MAEEDPSPEELVFQFRDWVTCSQLQVTAEEQARAAELSEWAEKEEWD